MNSYLERLQRELEDAVAGAGVGAMERAPAGKWNSAQILEHLLLTYKQSNRGLAKCMESGAPLATRAGFRERVARVLVIKFGYIPEGRKAPEGATPKGMPLEEVQQALTTELQQMDSGLNDCERKFGVRMKLMDHPFLGPLTAEEWRKFHWIHARHHARQIRRRAGAQPQP
jgi:Protein of unknown function (DUF1569)